MDLDSLTDSIIGAAIEVHRALGPGLLEAAYEECLCRELTLRGLTFERQRSLPIEYKGVKLDCGYRLDLLVAGVVVVEIKTIERFAPIHPAQLLTYLRLGGWPVGLLINFHVAVLKSGIKRVVNGYPEPLRSLRLRVEDGMTKADNDGRGDGCLYPRTTRRP